MDLGPGDELVEDRFALLLADGELLVGLEVPNLLLDVVELLVGGQRQRGPAVAGFERLEEVPSRVQIAAALDECRAALEASVERVRGVVTAR
jgi:hypothetical protein